jgi:transcriptional regulator with XRE-family HTH domain
MLRKGFGARVKALRKKTGMTQKQLGKKIGVHHINVGRYERDEVGPSVPALMRLARAFNVTLDFLVYGTDAMAHIKDEELFFLFKKVVALPAEDRLEAKQLVTTFLEQRRTNPAQR